MSGEGSTSIGRGPALIAAVVLGVGALGGLAWSVVRTAGAVEESVALQTAAPARGSARPAATPARSKTESGRAESAAPAVPPAPVEAPLVRVPVDNGRGPQVQGTDAVRPPAAPETGPASGQAEAPAAVQAPAKPVTPALPAKINLNTATVAELELLPGIGPSLAQRIIDHRQKVGKFRTVAELDKVKGIGPKTIEKLKGMATVE